MDANEFAKMVHVDDFIEDVSQDSYARFMFNHFRLAAALQFDFNEFVTDCRLFGTYKGERFRITGASRLGDVWLARDFERNTGYDLRVAVNEVSDFGPKP